MIIFLYGVDTYQSRQKLNQLKKRFLSEVDPTGINLVVLDGENLSISDFRQAVGASSFFAKRRMVVVEDLLLKGARKIQSEIIEYLDSPQFPADPIVVFWESQINEEGERKKGKISLPLFKRLRKEKLSQEFVPLKGIKLNQWINTVVTRRGGSIDKEAIEVLASSIGPNLWQLSSEIDKLVAYARSKNCQIDREMVNLLVEGEIKQNIFNLLDALGVRDRKLVLKLIHQELKQGANEIYLLSMLTRQFRILLQIKDILQKFEGGVSRSQFIARELSIHPYVAQKALGQARYFSQEELKNIYGELLQVDIAIKRGLLKPHIALDLLIAKL